MACGHHDGIALALPRWHRLVGGTVVTRRYSFCTSSKRTYVAAASDDPAVRTRIFATIDLAIGIVTTRRPVLRDRAIDRAFWRWARRRFSAGGLCLRLRGACRFRLRSRRHRLSGDAAAANFALSNPAREVLFTVVSREEKYKAKNVIDIVVFRGADAVTGWLFATLRGAGLELTTISLATVPFARLVVWQSLLLGLEQRAREITRVQRVSTRRS